MVLHSEGAAVEEEARRHGEESTGLMLAAGVDRLAAAVVHQWWRAQGSEHGHQLVWNGIGIHGGLICDLQVCRNGLGDLVLGEQWQNGAMGMVAERWNCGLIL
ncbi:hypothetical protein M0R45_025900 [Rubus argutus]|uniref:Uncharacterized protein n=1 Tax=Rubus argutus TaxID=59490 RepID=A0AAW1WXK7_RUBAR